MTALFQVLCVVLLTVFNLHISNTHRILGIFPFNGKSHNNMLEALMKGLARRGHQVDVITHFPVKDPPPNYRTIINLDGTLESVVNNFEIKFALELGDDLLYYVATKYGNRVCDLMELDKIQKFIKNPPDNPPYDVVITESFGANCFMGFGYLLKVPVIAVSTAVEYPWISDFHGNCDNPAVVPTAFTTAFGKMTFWERLRNLIVHYNSVYKFYSYTGESQTKAMRQYLTQNIPSVRDIEKSVALLIVNSHFTLFGVKSVNPSVIQVAGLHVEEDSTRLHSDLEKWMNESTDGIVYFTLGSLVLIETLPPSTIQAFYASFAKLSPIRVLMKIVDHRKLPQGLPDNVLTSSWIPQIPVLSHKNIRAFITHGGLMGVIEAIYHGVPMIGIPLFGDQSRNINAMVVKNISVLLKFHEITEDSLDRALEMILFNPTYRNNAKIVSKLFRDRPMSAMDTAAFWVDYIVRNGPNVLDSPAKNLTWWEVTLLDVYGFILAMTVLTIFCLIWITLAVYRYLSKFQKLGKLTKRE